MEFFAYISGTASIVSLLIAIVALHKVRKIQNELDQSYTKTKQTIDATSVRKSNLTQVGRDSGG